MRISRRASGFQESVIREMTRLHHIHGGVNLAQGFPDFEPPAEIVDAACRALRDGCNQYAITWGTKNLRDAVARHAVEFNGIACDAQANVTVCCGATETMIAALMAILNPGDRVIIFTPFYENYGPDTILSGAEPSFVPLHPPEAYGASWNYDSDELRTAFEKGVRAIIVNTPHNPTGKVFSRSELEEIALLCHKHDVIALTDEIYEHILYDGREHVSLASLEGMADRTITISGASKTFSVTGWRIGWAVAPADISTGIRRVHDFLTVGAPHPLQEAAAVALALPPSYFRGLSKSYQARRDYLLPELRAAGLEPSQPEGAYYTLAGFEGLGFADDLEATMHLVRELGVAVVPGSSFYPTGDPDGRRLIRFAFPKKRETLNAAAARLAPLAGRATPNPGRYPEP